MMDVTRAVLDSVAVPLTPRQREMAEIIAEEFLAAGLSPYVAAAALANAWAESHKLDPLAHNITDEDSAGLFQLRRDGGAGSDMPRGDPRWPVSPYCKSRGIYCKTDSRFDPVLNTRRIVREVRETSFGERFLSRIAAHPRDIPAIAADFCRYIERPGDVAEASAARAKIAHALFPRGIVSADRPRLADLANARPRNAALLALAPPLAIVLGFAVRDFWKSRY